MGFKDVLVSDLDTVFSLDEFAESVIFRGGPVSALVNYGTEQEENPRGNTTQALVAFRLDEIGGTVPAYGETVDIDGIIYTVVRLVGKDPLIAQVFCRAELRGSFRR